MTVAPGRIAATYAACRDQFRRAAADAGASTTSHPIEATGPGDEELTIDIASVGADRPRRAVLVLSGVHGVEGHVNSAIQTSLLRTLDADRLGDETAAVLVHAVNPWGMAHDRRQNESNVDLNRNWRRSDREPEHNAAYDELHPLACPDTPSLPPIDELLAIVGPVIERHGVDWVRDGITKGQYRRADGLHFGGHETEQSCAILERELPVWLGSVERLLTVDLHTGIGPHGEITKLSAQPPGSAQDTFLRDAFGEVDATVGTTGSASSPKSGPIAAGVADLFPDATCFAMTAEFGTVDDMAQLAATYQEQWVHRLGDLSDPTHAAVRRRYRDCFTPDDASWEQRCLDLGRELLDDAVAAVVDW